MSQIMHFIDEVGTGTDMTAERTLFSGDTTKLYNLNLVSTGTILVGLLDHLSQNISEIEIGL
jgi:hypothetical protein